MDQEQNYCSCGSVITNTGGCIDTVSIQYRYSIDKKEAKIYRYKKRPKMRPAGNLPHRDLVCIDNRYRYKGPDTKICIDKKNTETKFVSIKILSIHGPRAEPLQLWIGNYQYRWLYRYSIDTVSIQYR